MELVEVGVDLPVALVDLVEQGRLQVDAPEAKLRLLRHRGAPHGVRRLRHRRVRVRFLRQLRWFALNGLPGRRLRLLPVQQRGTAAYGYRTGQNTGCDLDSQPAEKPGARSRTGSRYPCPRGSTRRGGRGGCSPGHAFCRGGACGGACRTSGGPGCGGGDPGCSSGGRFSRASGPLSRAGGSGRHAGGRSTGGKNGGSRGSSLRIAACLCGGAEEVEQEGQGGETVELDALLLVVLHALFDGFAPVRQTAFDGVL